MKTITIEELEALKDAEKTIVDIRPQDQIGPREGTQLRIGAPVARARHAQDTPGIARIGDRPVERRQEQARLPR